MPSPGQMDRWDSRFPIRPNASCRIIPGYLRPDYPDYPSTSARMRFICPICPSVPECSSRSTRGAARPHGTPAGAPHASGGDRRAPSHWQACPRASVSLPAHSESRDRRPRRPRAGPWGCAALREQLRIRGIGNSGRLRGRELARRRGRDAGAIPSGFGQGYLRTREVSSGAGLGGARSEGFRSGSREACAGRSRLGAALRRCGAHGCAPAHARGEPSESGAAPAQAQDGKAALRRAQQSGESRASCARIG